MDVRRCNFAYKIGGAAILLFGLLPMMPVKESTAEESKPQHNKRSIISPISESRFTLRLTFDNGEVFEATQIEGEMIRIEKDGDTLGITPYRAAENSELKAKVFKVFPVRRFGSVVGEGVEELEEIGLEMRLSRVDSGNIGMYIEMVKVENVPKREVKKNPLTNRKTQ